MSSGDTTTFRLFASLAWTVLLAAPAAHGQEWPRFRGPNGAGHGKGDSIPVQWTEADYRWKVKLPGTGHGSPALWGERIFLMCCQERTTTRVVLCLSAADGSTLWSRPYKTGQFHQHQDNNLAATTPAVDAERIYLAWASPQSVELLALDHEGKEVWRRDLGPHSSQHGPCLTPMVYEDTVILANDQQGESFVIAVEAATGKTRWTLKRPSGKAAYGTPCLRRPRDADHEVIVTSTAAGITAIHPRSGQVLWERTDAMPERCVGSPVLAEDLVIASSGTGGSGRRLVAVRPTGNRKAEVVYDLKSNIPYVPTPLFKDGLLFLLNDTGGVSCLRAATGERIWQDKLPDRFYGSFVCVGERLYCISRSGKVYVLAAGDRYELLATNDLGEKSSATPAVAGGQMYLRTHSQLLCVGGSK